jgi:hypothetical protein
MNAEQLLMDRIQHEIDMEVLKEIGDKVGVDLTKEDKTKPHNEYVKDAIEGGTKL